MRAGDRGLMIAALVVVAAFLAVETGRAFANERAQRARGGVEPPGDVYRLMRVAYPGAFAVMFIEGLVRGGPALAVFLAGAALFGAAKALKWWAIRALGPAWTFRVVVVPGMSLVTSGPYRIMRHPNYLAVLGELAAVVLMTGARFTGPVVTVSFGLLMLKRAAVENRALDAILRRK